jgi:hypothetical protein
VSLLGEWILALQEMARSPSPVALLGLLLLAVPLLMLGRVVRRAGFSPWWALVVLVPLVNLVALWVFAYVRWPAIDDRPRRNG